MSESEDENLNGEVQPSLPFAAPCNDLETLAPINWIRLGWQDLKRSPIQSISYGAILVAGSFLMTYLAVTFGNLVVLLSLLSGFIFLGPLLAMAFYSISAQLQRNEKPTLKRSLVQSWHQVGNQMVFAVFLMIIFLVWARAASMTHVFFPSLAQPKLAELALFLTIGSMVGSLFAAFVFCVSAFSLPMMMDRKTDTVTAVVTSFNAVLRNKRAMLVWVLCIVAAVGLGILTAFIGFAISLPLIGHATWHAYQQTVDASAWPRNDA